MHKGRGRQADVAQNTGRASATHRAGNPMARGEGGKETLPKTLAKPVPPTFVMHERALLDKPAVAPKLLPTAAA